MYMLICANVCVCMHMCGHIAGQSCLQQHGWMDEFTV